MAKRRRKTRNEQWFTVLVGLALGFSILLSLIVSGLFLGHFDLNLFLWTFFITLIILLIGFIVLSLPSVKGRIGEARVNGKLKRLVQRYGGNLFHNVMVEGENGKTSQIDHIYVCEYGIFVIETKNYAGRIYGKDDQREWTQVLAFGNTKNHFYNPVKQNWTHVMRIKERLGDVQPESVVVFVQGNVSFIQSDCVYNLSGLSHLLDGFPYKSIQPTDVQRYSAAIQNLIDHPAKTNREHVKEIHQTQKELKEGICPRCGGKLVERTAKSTGKRFLGCSNYPKCKFTKNIDS